MQIDAYTNNPQELVNAIAYAIENDVLKTWTIVKNKKGETLYSHTPDQWAETAMPKPNVKTNRVTFYLTWWKKRGEPTHETKGYIAGRFTEMLLVHFAPNFSKLETTS